MLDENLYGLLQLRETQKGVSVNSVREGSGVACDVVCCLKVQTQGSVTANIGPSVLFSLQESGEFCTRIFLCTRMV